MIRQTYRNFLTFAMLTATSGMIAGSAAALPALSDVKEVRDPLIITAVAWEISETCDTIRPRKIRGIQYLYGIRSKALKLGYTSAQIEAYVDDKAEKDHIEGLARQQLRVMIRDIGKTADPDANCALGREQIKKNTLIGRLLY